MHNVRRNKNRLRLMSSSFVKRQHISSTTTEATTTHTTNHVKTFQAYSGSLQTPKNKPKKAEPAGAEIPQPSPYYYKPLVQPVYQPAVTQHVEEVEHLPPPPPPPPPPVVVKHLPAATPYSPQQQLGFTTPHPLIYGFKPVQEYPTPPPAGYKHHRPAVAAARPHPPPRRPQHPSTRGHSGFFGDLRTVYSSNRPKKLPVAHTKPIRFPLAARSFFRSVFST